MAVNEAPPPSPPASHEGRERFADRIVAMAERLGVQFAFGLIGSACVPLADALGKSSIRVVQTRHDAGAAFSAAQASLCTGNPVLVFTTGPGLLNALNGLVAGRWDGAKVLVVSASTGATHRRHPVQETVATMPINLLSGTGAWFDFDIVVEDAAELAGIENALSLGFTGLGGFIGHLAVPIAMHARPAPAQRPPPQIGATRPRYGPDVAGAVAAILKDGPFAIWLGAGAVGAAKQVRELVDRAGAPFMVSPRAKGTVSERHPLYLGVTGPGGHGDIDIELAELGINRLLVLGTRLGECTSFYRKTLVPPGGIVHIDVDRSVFGAAYPDVETLGIEAEVGPFLHDVLTQVGHQHLVRPPRSPFPPERPERDIAGVHPRSVMHAIQRVVVDASDALVLADGGNVFGWANHHLMFAQAGRYRTSPAWGSIGDMVAGAVGAATASEKPVVVLTGDAAMLTSNEINTAVQEGLPIVWVVLNDAGDSTLRDGNRAPAVGHSGVEFPETDFVAFARSQGASGRTVYDAIALDSALIEALQSKRPFVVDVKTARGQPSPQFMQHTPSPTTGKGAKGNE